VTAAGPLPVGRAARVLVRLRWRRVRNRMFARAQKSGGGGARVATASRGRNAWLGALLGVYFPFLAFKISSALLGTFDHHFPRGTPGHELRELVRPLLTTELGMLALAAVVASLATRELSAPEWDLEWLVTLPLPRRTLLGLRILERTIVNPTGFLLLWPFATTIAWQNGLRVGAPLLGAACALPLLVLVAVVWVVLETTLRMRLPPQRLRNAQALMTILSFATFFLAWSPSTGSPLIYSVTDALGPLARWTPMGLAIAALTSDGPSAAAVPLVALAVDAAVALVLGVLWLERLLRHGVVSTGAREGGRRGLRAPRPLAAARPARLAWLTPVQRRELRLLGRDRNFLVQTLLMPLIIVGLQVYVRSRHLSLAHAIPPTSWRRPSASRPTPSSSRPS
jgi:ABC-2 type transport system permease protein